MKRVAGYSARGVNKTFNELGLLGWSQSRKENMLKSTVNRSLELTFIGGKKKRKNKR